MNEAGIHARRRADTLAECLKRERSLLRLGKYRQLGKAQAATGKALDALLRHEENMIPEIRDGIERICRDAKRNGALYRAAIDGLEAARDQIRSLKFAPAGLRIYTRAGDRMELGAAETGSQRKL